MEPNTIIAPVADTATEQKPANKAAKGQSAKMVNVYEVVRGEVMKGTDSSTIHSFDLSDFPKGIGQMLAKFDGAAQFTYLGKKFVVPALTANNSNPERAAMIFKQLVANIFPASIERSTVIDSKSEPARVILSLKSAGFKFKTVCKAEVAEAINIWLTNKRLKIAVAKESARKENIGMVAQNKVLRPLVKELRADNLSLITGLEKKAAKQLS